MHSMIFVFATLLAVLPLPSFAQHTEAPASSVTTLETDTYVAPLDDRGLSEFSFQPQRHGLALSATPAYSNHGYQLSFSDGPILYSESMKDLRIDGSYGLSDRISVGIATSYGETEGEVLGARQKLRKSGWSDVLAYVRGFQPVGATRFLYRLTGTVSPTEQIEATSVENGNRVSGGNTLAPLVGLEAVLGSRGTLGTFLSYKLAGETRTRVRTRNDNYEMTGSGANILSAGGFGEVNMGAARVGGLISMNWHQGKTYSFSDNSARDIEDPYNATTLNAYIGAQASENLDLKIEVESSSASDRRINNIRLRDEYFMTWMMTGRLTI